MNKVIKPETIEATEAIGAINSDRATQILDQMQLLNEELRTYLTSTNLTDDINKTGVNKSKGKNKNNKSKNNKPNTQALAQLNYPCVYVDGANQYTGGGWAVVLYMDEDSTIERGGKVDDTTNNRMELQAAIEACKLLTELGLDQFSRKINLYTDSQYVQKGITEWIHGWKRSDWRNDTIKNQDLWIELDALNLPVIDWKWVKGHSGVEGNERADMIAEGFASNKPVPLQNVLD